MKVLEQLLAQGRSASRRVRARLPAQELRPGRLVLRLNDVGVPDGLPRAAEGELTLDDWQKIVVGFLHWLGPMRVTVGGGEPGLSERLEPLVRFANRLECPTHLITSGAGLETIDAEVLVDRGLAAVTVKVASLDPDQHEAIVGHPLAAATELVEAFREARLDRQRPLSILVAVPLTGVNLDVLPTVAAWASQAGADGVVPMVPLGRPRPSGLADAVDALGSSDRSHRALHGLLSGHARSLPGGPRAEVLSDGTLLASAVGNALGNVRRADPKEVWEGAGDALAAVRELERPWNEVELVPELLLSRR